VSKELDYYYKKQFVLDIEAFVDHAWDEEHMKEEVKRKANAAQYAVQKLKKHND
jgi:hypothetical protein